MCGTHVRVLAHFFMLVHQNAQLTPRLLHRGRPAGNFSMAANQLRFGIIGTGAMGLEHIRNLRLVKKATVTAIADTSERMRAIARDLLDRCGMDAAVLRCRNSLLSGTRHWCDAEIITTCWQGMMWTQCLLQHRITLTLM